MLFFLVCSACAMPETKIYSIDPSFSSPSFREDISRNIRQATDERKSLAIVVDAPKHLLQPYIVYRSSPYQLEIARYSKWVSTPAEMMRQALVEHFSSTGLLKEVRGSLTVRDECYVIEISLKRFEQSREGKVFFGDILFDLKLISPNGTEVARKGFSRHITLDDDTFLSLAKGLSSALPETVREVSDLVLPSLAP